MPELFSDIMRDSGNSMEFMGASEETAGDTQQCQDTEPAADDHMGATTLGVWVQADSHVGLYAAVDPAHA